MSIYYESVAQLLGTTGERRDELLIKLIDLMEMEPKGLPFGRFSSIEFCNAGLLLQYSRDNQAFTGATWLTNRHHEEFKPIFRKMELPYGVLFTDTRMQVEAKFRGGVMARKDYRFDRDIRPLELMFCFEPQTEKMNGMHLKYCDNCLIKQKE